MTPAYAAFTERGLRLAEKLAASLPGSVTRCGHGGPALAQWTAAEFVRSDALVFVGAVGIAVRAIAPHCQSKASDPAVVVLDECGASRCRSCPAIWAGPTIWHASFLRSAGRCRSSPRRRMPTGFSLWTSGRSIKIVRCWNRRGSSRQWEAAGRADRFCLVGIFPFRRGSCGGNSDPNAGRSRLRPDLFPAGNALHLIPRIGVLGVGCKRGTTTEQLEAAFAAFCETHGLAPACICAAASIDLKQNEAGLLAFCQAHR